MFMSWLRHRPFITTFFYSWWFHLLYSVFPLSCSPTFSLSSSFLSPFLTLIICAGIISVSYFLYSLTASSPFFPSLEKRSMSTLVMSLQPCYKFLRLNNFLQTVHLYEKSECCSFKCLSNLHLPVKA